MRYLYEVLIVVITFDIIGTIRVHNGPIVAYSECLVSKAVSLGMVAILTLMKLC